MPLALTLELDQTDLLVQQDTPARLTILNNGPNAAVFPDPQLAPEIPSLRIVEVRSGVEIVRQRRPYPQGSKLRTLPVGESLEHEFTLMDVAHIHTPGEYLVSAIVRSNGGKDVAESAPIKITITPVTPKTLDSVYVQGGHAFIKYTVSLNLNFDPPRVTRHSMLLRKGGGITDAQTVAPATMISRPTLSAPRNQQVSHDHWIAWLDGLKLSAVHTSLFEGPAKPSSFSDFPKDEAVAPLLISPLSIDANSEAEGRMPGTAFLWVPSKDTGSITAFHLVPDQPPAPSGNAPVPGPRPSWAMLVDPFETPRGIYFTQERGEPAAPQSQLRLLPWPRQANPGEIKTLHTLTGSVIGGDVLLDNTDTANGALLVLSDLRNRALSLQSFTYSQQAGFKAGAVHEIPWPFSTEIAASIVRIGPGGAPAALLKNPDNEWSIYTPTRGLQRVPADLSPSIAALDLAFFGNDPVFVVGRPMNGLEILQLDGKPIPHQCH